MPAEGAGQALRSAGELAEDLRRFLDGEPIRPGRRLPERAWKATRRHPMVAIAGLVVAGLAVLGCAGLAWRWHMAETALTRTENRLAAAEWGLYRNRIGQRGT